jgi:hypothetical protein
MPLTDLKETTRMNNSILNLAPEDNGRSEPSEATAPTQQPDWETPQMEDVSEQVMAQPYIRFT